MMKYIFTFSAPASCGYFRHSVIVDMEKIQFPTAHNIANNVIARARAAIGPRARVIEARAVL